MLTVSPAEWVPLGLMLAATGTLVHSWAWHWDPTRGRQRCRRCWFDVAAQVAAQSRGGRVTCPECGWRAKCVADTCATRPNRAALYAGVTLLIVGLNLVWLGPRLALRGPLSLLPTSALLALIARATDDSITPSWRSSSALDQELAARALSHAQRQRALRALLAGDTPRALMPGSPIPRPMRAAASRAVLVDRCDLRSASVWWNYIHRRNRPVPAGTRSRPDPGRYTPWWYGPEHDSMLRSSQHLWGWRHWELQPVPPGDTQALVLGSVLCFDQQGAHTEQLVWQAVPVVRDIRAVMRPWSHNARAQWLHYKIDTWFDDVLVVLVAVPPERIKDVSVGLRAEVLRFGVPVAWARGSLNERANDTALRLNGNLAALARADLTDGSWDMRLCTDEPLAILDPRARFYWRGDFRTPLLNAGFPAPSLVNTARFRPWTAKPSQRWSPRADSKDHDPAPRSPHGED